MKKLYLVRHAKSSWEDHYQSDHERGLNSRGKRDAPMIGEILKKQNVTTDIIISSDATRALTTAKIIAQKIGYDKKRIIQDKNIYEATTQNLLNVINSIDDKNNSAMLCGHNPGSTVLANLIADKYINNMPTCAVAAIELDVESWKDVNADCGKLVGFEYPKKYS